MALQILFPESGPIPSFWSLFFPSLAKLEAVILIQFRTLMIIRVCGCLPLTRCEKLAYLIICMDASGCCEFSLAARGWPWAWDLVRSRSLPSSTVQRNSWKISITFKIQKFDIRLLMSLGIFLNSHLDINQ